MALAAQRFAHLAAEVDAVDELHLAFALGGLFVREHPHIGCNARVVEHVGGQCDDGFEQIAFQNMAADFGFARACTAGEERRAIEDDADA